MESRKILQIEIDAIDEALEAIDEAEKFKRNSAVFSSDRKLLTDRRARLVKRLDHAE